MRSHKARADAAQATETFLAYQRTAEKRELRLRGLLDAGKSGAANSATLDSRISETRMKLQQPGRRPADPPAVGTGAGCVGGSSSSSSSSTNGVGSGSGSSEADIRRLREQLDAARDELNVFRRLDVYSASFRRGLAEHRESRGDKLR